MITVKCPECGAGLEIGFSGETKEGWKVCKNCGEPSFSSIREGKCGNAKSLRSMILESKNRELLARALFYILEHEEAYLDDIYFNVGMKVKPDLELLERYQVLQRIGNHYVLNKVLVDFVENYIFDFLPRNQKVKLEDLF